MERVRTGVRRPRFRGLPQETLAPLVVAALLLLTGVANLLWGVGVPNTSNAARISPDTDPFPLIPAGPVLHVLPVPWTTNTSLRLALVSLQGLVNRGGAALYLDTDNETGNASSLLTFLEHRYGVAVDSVDLAWVYAHYLSAVRGIVVTDPARPESVNIGTMVAALEDALVTGPDLAPSLHATTGLPILLDYAASNWTATDAAGAYDRALRELYPVCDPNLLAILPPNQAEPRDYLIATRTFVFYEPQGILATPAQLASTQRILAAAPRGIPVLGWFDSPTLTEENAFIQMASRYGKAMVGSEAVPNLSVLTAFGRNVVRAQPSPAIAPPLASKTYAVVAISDGDNLEFVANRMWDLWNEPQRGTMPLAWTLNPLLGDLAPPYLDYYYSGASANDRFVMAPSGAGYVYPDYLGPGDLGPYLEATSHYANETGLAVPWLLNAFVASEIPYRSSTLSAYVDALHPRGIVLDYDDQPKLQDVWMQAGATTAAPVIRSTQLWTTLDNLYGKVDDAFASWGGGAHFIWITVYPFRFDLADAAAAVAGLSARSGGNLVVVTPEQLFTLMEEDFVARAQAQLASLRADPFASVFLRSALDEAQGWLDAPVSPADPAMSAYHAYAAIADLREAGLAEAVVASGLVVVLAAAVSLRRVGRGSEAVRAQLVSARPLPILAAAFALLLLATRAALATNFWSYQWIVVGLVLAGVGRPFRRYLDRTYARVSLLATAGLDLVFIALALATNVAFVLAAVGTVAIVDAVLARERVPPAGLVLALTLGTAAGFLAPLGAPAFGLFGVLLLAPLAGARAGPRSMEATRPRGALPRGFVVALPVAILMAASNYSTGLRAGLAGEELPALAAALLVLGPLAGLLLARAMPTQRRGRIQAFAFVAAALFAALLFVVTGTVATALVLLGLGASLAIAAEATLARMRERGEPLAPALTAAVSWIPLFLLFFRMPPVVYSLTLVHFPEAVEAALYAPAALFVAVFAALALLTLLRLRREGHVRKGYPPTASVGGGRSP